jgi:hypothetical protein
MAPAENPAPPLPDPVFDLASRPAGVGACAVTEAVGFDGQLAAVRVEHFLTDDYAQALAEHLATRIVYEPDHIGDTKRAGRAARTGDMPDSPLVTRGAADPVATAAMGIFAGPWLLGQLEGWFRRPLRVLRPTTPYRMDMGDFIDPHDDYPAPEYRLSISCNLTRRWTAGDGGQTVVGVVDRVEEYDDPEWFFPLERWTLRPGAKELVPMFNSLLLLPLDATRGHAVRRVNRGPRYSLTTLYGDRVHP